MTAGGIAKDSGDCVVVFSVMIGVGACFIGLRIVASCCILMISVG